MTALATRRVHDEQGDFLQLLADQWTPASGKPWFDRFRAACWEVARRHDGWIDPSLVRGLLLDDPDYDPRRLSAAWCRASTPHGFLDVTDRWVPITGEGSRGNGNKSLRYRRWRVGVPAAP